MKWFHQELTCGWSSDIWEYQVKRIGKKNTYTSWTKKKIRWKENTHKENQQNSIRINATEHNVKATEERKEKKTIHSNNNNSDDNDDDDGDDDDQQIFFSGSTWIGAGKMHGIICSWLHSINGIQWKEHRNPEKSTKIHEPKIKSHAQQYVTYKQQQRQKMKKKTREKQNLPFQRIWNVQFCPQIHNEMGVFVQGRKKMHLFLPENFNRSYVFFFSLF